MINECLSIFLEEYEKDNGNLLFSNYLLAPGNYYFVNIENGEIIEDVLISNKDGERTEIYREFLKRDYWSRLLTMNKPIDSTKQIHSNNYLSFFVKKDKISGQNADLKKIKESIVNYFKVFRDYSSHYDKEKYTLLQKLEIIDFDNRNDEIEKIEQWLLSRIDHIENLRNFKNDKNYVKIFFVNSAKSIGEGLPENLYDLQKYENESRKYVIPNIFNSNKYNKKIRDEIFGVHNNNFGLNAKKPYLVSKTKKFQLPSMINISEAIEYKKFFDWLHALSMNKLNNVYIGKVAFENGVNNYVKAFPSLSSISDESFKGFYIRLKQEKNEAEIIDFDIISKINTSSERFYFRDYLDMTDKQRFDFYRTEGKSISSSLPIIDKFIFSNRLIYGLFDEEKNISRDDPDLKSAILDIRKSIIDWYYKGKDLKSYNNINSITYDLLLRFLKKNQFLYFKNGYNVRKSILNYMNGNKKEEVNSMAEIDMRNELKRKLTNKDIIPIETNEEFAFALGQLWYYLISQSEAQDKNYSMILPIMQTDKLNRIKTLTSSMVEKYSHALNVNFARFNRLLSLVMSYDRNLSKDSKDWILAGFATNNLLFEKDDKK